MRQAIPTSTWVLGKYRATAHGEVGLHTLKFHNALRAALREDPDVILVGEIRDQETLSTALEAAQTGHLVFGTLHTNSAPETIDRIIDAYPHEQQAQVRTMLSASLAAVVTQTLVRKERGPGRVAAHEVMIATSAIRNLIRENKLHQIPSIMQASKADGMLLMSSSLKKLADQGVISRQRAINISNNPRLFDE